MIHWSNNSVAQHLPTASLSQDRKPLTTLEPIHDENKKSVAAELMDKEEGKHDMEDFIEAWDILSYFIYLRDPWGMVHEKSCQFIGSTGPINLSQVSLYAPINHHHTGWIESRIPSAPKRIISGQVQRKMKQAAREEEAEAEDMDKFTREQDEAEEADKNKGRGRGRGQGRGRGRGKGKSNKGKGKGKRSEAKTKQKNDEGGDKDDDEGNKETTTGQVSEKEDETPAKAKPAGKKRKGLVRSPSQKNLDKMRRMKAMKSSDNLEPKTTKRNLDADFEEAEGVEHAENPKTPEKKRRAPSGEDRKGRKAAKPDNTDEPQQSASSKPKEGQEKGEDEPKPKVKKNPRGSPGKIKKTTDREGLERQEGPRCHVKLCYFYGIKVEINTLTGSWPK